MIVPASPPIPHLLMNTTTDRFHPGSLLLLVLAGMLGFSVTTAGSAIAETLVYIGTYTKGDSNSDGIYVCSLDESSGELSKPRLAAKAVNPSFVAIAPNGRYLYAVSEVPDGGEDSKGLIAFSIQPDGTLQEINTMSTGGAAACHVAVNPSGALVGVANYSGGSCAIFPVLRDGSVGNAIAFHQHHGSSVNPRRQQAPHAHSINFNRDGTQAFVADLGIDKILVYDINLRTGAMLPASPPSLSMPAGGGPRHFCLSPSGRFALSNLELTSQVTLLRLGSSKRGQTNSLDLVQTISTLPEGATVPGNSTAECLFHPDGKFAYVSNRGHDSIAVLQVDESEASIKRVANVSSGGQTPRGFGISPDGYFVVVANQKTGNVVSMRVDRKDGSLTPTGSEIHLDAPVNVRFLRRD